MLGGSLVLLVTVAPFISAGSDDSAFWDFNRASWVAAAFGLLVAVILAIGLSAADAAADGGLDLNDEIHGRAVLAAFGLDYISDWRDVAIFRHWSGRWAVLDVADFAIVGWVSLAPARSQGLAGEGSDRAYTIVLDAAGRAVTVTGTGDEAVEVDLTDLLARLNRHDAENPWPVPADEMTPGGQQRHAACAAAVRVAQRHHRLRRPEGDRGRRHRLDRPPRGGALIAIPPLPPPAARGPWCAW